MITEQPGTSQGEQKTTPPFKINKVGHVVFFVADLDRAIKFYTEVLPFKVSDRNEQGMVFLRCAAGDHHTLALVPRPNGQAPAADAIRVHHFAMEVDSMDTLFTIRDWLKQNGVEFTYEGRRGPGSNPGLEFLDPDGHAVELYADMDKVDWETGVSRPGDQWRRAASLEEVVANPLPQWPPAK